MKFAHQLKQGAVEEWQRAYVDYRLLKKLIKAAAVSAPREGNAVESEAEQLMAPAPPAQELTDHDRASDSSPDPERLHASRADGTRIDSRCTNASSDKEQAAAAGSSRDSIRQSSCNGPSQPSAQQPSPLRLQPFTRSSSLSSSIVAVPEGPARRSNWTGRPDNFRLPQTRWRYPPDKPLGDLIDSMLPAEKRFFTTLDAELEKVNCFYKEREAEAVERCRVLKEQLDQLAEHRTEYLERRFAPSHLVQPLLHQSKRVLCGDSDGAEGPMPGRDSEGQDINQARQRVVRPEQRDTRAHDDGSDLEDGHTRTVHPSWRDEQGHSHLHFRAETYMLARRKLKLATFETCEALFTDIMVAPLLKSRIIWIIVADKLLGYIQNYRLLNRTAFSKATKKMEKLTRIRCQAAYVDNVEKTYFGRSTIIDDLQSQIEAMFGSSFEKGSRKEALERLRYSGASPNHHFATWRAGLLLGAAIAALIAGLVKSSRADVRARVPYFAALLQIYGAMVLPVLLAVGAGINLIAWHRAHINVNLIYSFDLRTALDFRQYLEIPAFFFCTLSYCLWLSFTVISDTISPQVWPLVWLFSTAAILFNPLPVFHKSARWWIIRTTARVLSAGTATVEFRDFWLGDQFCSLYYTSLSLGFLVCSYGHHFAPGVGMTCSSHKSWASPALAALPFLLRLGQSVRRYIDEPRKRNHLLNAGKYGASVLYYFFYYNYRIKGSHHDASFSLFIVSGCVNSCYSLTWDVLMDWDLLKRNARYRFLRNELAYSRHWVYYAAIVLNTLLRFSWVLHFVPHVNLRLEGFIIGLIETSRRWLWNFMRIESEHVGNVDGYRVTRDVPLPYAIPMQHGRHTASLDGIFARDDIEEGNEPHHTLAHGHKASEHHGLEQKRPLRQGKQHSLFDALLPGELGRKLKASMLRRHGKE